MAEVINSAIFHMCAQQSRIAEQENAPVLDLFEYAAACLRCLAEEGSKSLQSIKDKNGVTIGEKRHQRPAKWVEGYDEYWNNPEYFVVDILTRTDLARIYLRLF